jgi:outer membrane protein assembly factor BamB
MNLDDRIQETADEAARVFDHAEVPEFDPPRARGPLVAIASALVVGVAILVAAWVGTGPGDEQANGVSTTVLGTSTAPSSSTTASSTTTATPDGVLVIPRTITGGSDVFDITLDDSSRFAVLVPTGMVQSPVTITTDRTSAHLSGDSLEATLTLETCPGDTQDRGAVNARGALIAASGSSILVCRPDEFLVLDITGTNEMDHDAVDGFDIVPIVIGDDYAAIADTPWIGYAGDFGPITIGDVVVTANGWASGRVTAWSRDVLVPRWDVSLGNTSILLGSDGTRVLATPADGPVAALDVTTGERLWETPLPEGFTIVGAAADPTQQVWYLTIDAESEGETVAPRLIAVDGNDGTILWEADGDEATRLQWADPAVFDDAVAILDVPRYVDQVGVADTGHVIAFDPATGQRRWTVEVDSDESFSHGLLAADPNRNVLIAATPTGHVVSIDPTSGEVRWVTDLPFSLIVAIEDDTVALLQGSNEVRLNIDTGEVINEPEALPSVTPLQVEQSVPLTIFTARGNTADAAVVDLAAATTTVLNSDTAAWTSQPQGAVLTPSREFVVWTDEPAVYVFTSDLTDPELEIRPESNLVSSFAPALRVIPTPHGDALWVVQPGVAYGTINVPTRVELFELSTGDRLATFEVEPNAFPAGATDAGLVLNTERLVDTGDGWVAEPGSEQVIVADTAGTVTEVGPGRAIATAAETIVRRVCAPDDQYDCDLWIGDSGVAVARRGDGTWQPVGGPAIPSETMPLPAISPDGTTLLIGFGEDPDINGTPARVTLYTIDLANSSTHQIATFQNGYPLATWSADGQWIAVIGSRDITMYKADNPTSSFVVANAIPENHYPLAAG